MADISQLSDEELNALSDTTAPTSTPPSSSLSDMSDAELDALSAATSPSATTTAPPILPNATLEVPNELPLTQAPMNLPYTVPLSTEGAPATAPQFEIPKAPQQESITFPRLVQGLTAGIIQLPGMIQAAQDLQAETPISKFLRKNRLEPASTEEILKPVVGEQAAGVLGYEPQTGPEIGAQIFGELLSGTVLEHLNKVKTVEKTAMSRVQQEARLKVLRDETRFGENKVPIIAEFQTPGPSSPLDVALDGELRAAQESQQRLNRQMNPPARKSHEKELDKIINEKGKLAAKDEALPESRLAVLDILSQRAAEKEVYFNRRLAATQNKIDTLDVLPNTEAWGAEASRLEGERQLIVNEYAGQRRRITADLNATKPGKRSEFKRRRLNSKLIEINVQEAEEIADIAEQRQNLNLSYPDQEKLARKDAYKAELAQINQQKTLELDVLGAQVKPRQNELARNLQFKEDLLLKRRKELQHKISLTRPKGERAVQLAKQMDEISNQVAAIEEVRQVAKLPPNKPGSGLSGVDTIIRDAKDLAVARVRLVTDAVNSGAIPREQAQLLAQAEYFDTLRKNGVTINNTVFEPNGWLDNSTALNALDNKLGTNTAQTYLNGYPAKNAAFVTEAETFAHANEIADKLNALTYSDNDISLYMQYYNRDGVFDPSARSTRSLVRPEFRGTAPSPQADALFKEMRMKFNEYGANYLDPDAFNEAFLPHVRKSTGPGDVKPSLLQKTEQGIVQQRTHGYLNPDIHETNFREIMRRYSRQYATQKDIAPILAQAQKERLKLMLEGQNKAANFFDEMLAQSFGITQKGDMAEIISGDIIRRNNELFQELAAQTPDPDGFWNAFGKEIKCGMYNVWIAANSPSVIKNAIQPFTYAIADMGAKAVANGYRLATKVGVEAKLLSPTIDRLMRMNVRPDAIGDLALLDKAFKNKNPLVRGLRLTNDIMERTISRGFTATEKLNRRTVIGGAYMQAKDALANGGWGALDGLTKNMRNSERIFIRNAFDKQGPEAAMEAYALMRDARNNFIYTNMNDPQKVAKMLKHIPFTTYTRAVWNSHIAAVQEGKYGAVFKRIVPVMIGAYLLEEATGRTLKGSTPLETLVGVRGQLLPQITQVTEELGQGDLKGAIKSAVSPTIIGAALDTYNNATDSDKDMWEKLGFEDKDKSWLRKMLGQVEEMDVEDIIEP